MRMFERALARTDLPVRFSEGFNPRPRLSLPLPRPVGVATTVDCLVVEFTCETVPEEVLSRLSAQMPAGVTLRSAWIPPNRRALQPVAATYSVTVPAERVAAVGEQLERLRGAAEWPVHRSEGPGGPEKTLDLKSYLADAGFDSGRLVWTVRVTGGGSIRPSEFLAAAGLDPREWQHRVTRTAIEWEAEPAGSAPPGSAECDEA